MASKNVNCSQDAVWQLLNDSELQAGKQQILGDDVPVQTWVKRRQRTFNCDDCIFSFMRVINGKLWCGGIDRQVHLIDKKLKVDFRESKFIGGFNDNLDRVNDFAHLRGDLAVVATDGGLYEMRDALGDKLGKFGGSAEYSHVAVYEGRVYAVNSDYHRINVYERNPNPRSWFGRPPCRWRKVRSFELMFLSKIDELVVEDDHIKLVSARNHRIMYYTLEGAIESFESLPTKTSKFVSACDPVDEPDSLLMLDDENKRLLVKTGSGDVREIRLQPPPKKMPEYAMFFDGHLYVKYDEEYDDCTLVKYACLEDSDSE